MPIKIVRKKQTAVVQTSARKPQRRGVGRPLKFGKLLSHLGQERLAMVESRLLNGETAEAIAKTIKLEWKLCEDMKLGALSVRLNEYRRDNLLTKLKYLSEHGKGDAIYKFADKVDVLENLTKLVELQQGRVSKALHAESTNNPLHPLNRTAKFEVQLLANLYKQLSDLQMDLGLIRKVPAKLMIEGGAARAQQALELAMQRSARVEQALSKAFEVIDGKFSVAPHGTATH